MNRKVDHTIVLITGARAGIGAACARTLTAHGYRVYGTSRTPLDVDPGYRMVAMDVNDDASVAHGVQTVLDEAGGIDVVVNNAGFGYGGSVEDTSLEEAKATFETNVFGVLRVCRAVLPTMRAQGRGYIVNISSIGGLMGLPYQGLYSASKFALEGLTESLRMEILPFGIHAVLLEPGDICTPFTANRRSVQGAVSNPAYREQYATTLAKIEADEQGGASPDVVARALLRLLRHRRPKLRYVVGPVYEQLAVVARRVLPDRLFQWLLMQNYGIKS